MGTFTKAFGGMGGQWALSNTFKDTASANLMIEGHSFVATGTSMDNLFKYGINTSGYYNGAVGGTNIAAMVSRAATLDSKIVVETSTNKNLLIIYNGVNNVDNTVGSGTATYNALKSYIQARILAGHKRIFTYTMTPSTEGGRSAQFEIERNVFNNSLRNDLVLFPEVKILDTDTVPELADCTNATFYADLLHPTTAGAYPMSQLFVSKLKIIGLGGVVAKSYDFTLTQTGDGSGIAQLTVFTNAIVAFKLSGNANFYSDAAGTLNPTKLFLATTSTTLTLYIKCTGPAILTMDRNRLFNIPYPGWKNVANAPSLGGDIGVVTSLTNFSIAGLNTLSGNINNLPSLVSFSAAGNNALSGDISINNKFINVVIATNSGGIICPNVLNLGALYNLDLRGLLLTSNNINQILADMWANRDVAKATTTRYIDLTGVVGSGAPTGQGLIDKANLQAYRSPNNDSSKPFWTVLTR